MPLLPEPKREHPSTYFVQDRSNQEELNRLQIQDALLTAQMGGVLPEQPASALFNRVLDVGCGTGGWLIELAKTRPEIELLIGVDVSRTFVEYARAQAAAAQVSDRVEFYAMDALLILEFPNDFFDLVNQRAAASWLRTWDWPKLLQEYQRVCRPGGVVRISELDRNTAPTPACTRYSDLFTRAFYQAGHMFTPTPDGVTSSLAKLLYQHGLGQIQTRSCDLEYPYGSPAWQLFFETSKLGLRTMTPFLRKWIPMPEDFEELCQQLVREMQQPEFVATAHLLTAWGEVLSTPGEAVTG